MLKGNRNLSVFYCDPKHGDAGKIYLFQAPAVSYFLLPVSEAFVFKKTRGRVGNVLP